MTDSSSAVKSGSASGGPSLQVVPPAQEPSRTAVHPGGFWRRLVAVIIDAVILFVLEKPVFMLLGISHVLSQPLVSNGEFGATPEQKSAHLIAFGVGGLIQILYAYGFYRWKKATVGKLALGLQVVDLSTGERLTFGQTVIREFFGKWLSCVVLMIGFLMVPFRRDKRALHDFLASTQVQKK